MSNLTSMGHFNFEAISIWNGCTGWKDVNRKLVIHIFVVNLLELKLGSAMGHRARGKLTILPLFPPPRLNAPGFHYSPTIRVLFSFHQLPGAGHYRSQESKLVPRLNCKCRTPNPGPLSSVFLLMLHCSLFSLPKDIRVSNLAQRNCRHLTIFR